MNNLALQPYARAKVAELDEHAKRLGILIHIAGVPFGAESAAPPSSRSDEGSGLTPSEHGFSAAAASLSRDDGPSNEAIEAAIKATEYKYFGDYPLSDGQQDAIGVFVAAGRALIRSRLLPAAASEGASPEAVIPAALRAQGEVHNVKCWPEYWDAIHAGIKTFDVRRDDRGYELGDHLVLKRFDPNCDEKYQDASPSITKRIIYILNGGQFGVESGYVVLGLADDEPRGLSASEGASPEAVNQAALRAQGKSLINTVDLRYRDEHFDALLAEIDTVRAQVIEECAKVIVDNMLCDDDDGSEVLLPRTNPGNKVGFAYAEAIRSLSAVSAIAQERDVGEPVAWQWKQTDPFSGAPFWHHDQYYNGNRSEVSRPLYLHPTTSPKAISEAPTSADAVSSSAIDHAEVETLANRMWGPLGPFQAEVQMKCASTLRKLSAHIIALDAERGRMREALMQARASFQAIQRATIEGRVCDDVAWFSDITTLHDYCASEIEIIDKSIAQMRDRFG